MADSNDVAMVSGDEENAPPPRGAVAAMDQEQPQPQQPAPPMEETVRENDDDQQQQQQQAQEDLQNATLGGTVSTPCFCLLDGIILTTASSNNSSNNKDESAAAAAGAAASNDDRDSKKERLSVPITRLPAVLGRAHQTDDANFIPVGAFTTISRQHCKIEYWCNSTGRLEQTSSSSSNKKKNPEDDEEQEFSYNSKKEKEYNKLFSKDKLLETDKKKPFYTITCLGKNRIFVNKEKLEKGETAVLPNGAAIRLSNTCFLYFLLPAKPSSKKTLEITMEPSRPTKKRKTSFTVTSSGLTAKGGGGGGGGDNNSTTTSPKRGRGVSHIQAELDKLSNDELRRQLTAAIQDDIWERRHQLIGSTLSGRAILAVAHDETLRAKCQTEQGLSRGEIMDWIAASDEFAEWSQQMLNKLEIKSYQSSITKAMIKAGFTRTASTGRYIKWMLPDMKMSAVTGKVKKNSAEQPDAQEEPAQAGSGVDHEDADSEDEDDKHGENKEEIEKADGKDSDNENKAGSAREADGGDDDKAEMGNNQKEADDESEDETSETKDELRFDKKMATSASSAKQDDDQVVAWSIREP